MSKLFLDIFNISIAASWMIGAVILLRLAMKKRAPKWTVCLLWAVVAVRLLIPFGFESELSLVPSKETIKPEAVYTETAPRLPSTQSPSHNPEIPKDDFESPKSSHPGAK